jgi:hypothetical protein
VVDFGSVEAGERNVVGDWGCCCWERDEAAGGGPEDRGEVGAKGSSKIVSVWARRVLICGTVESANHRSTTARTDLLMETIKVVMWIVRGFTWIIRRMMNEFDALVLETFIEPIGTELEDIARPFPMNCAIEVVQKIHILRRETTLRGRGGGSRRRSRGGRRGHGGERLRDYRISGDAAAQPIETEGGNRRVVARSGEFKVDWIGDGTASWEL